MKIDITGKQYSMLARLAKVCNEIDNRRWVAHICYRADMDKFVAVDGHILRMEDGDFAPEEKPKFTFLIEAKTLVMTDAMLRKIYGKDFANKHIEISTSDNSGEAKFPDFSHVIPSLSDAAPTIALCLDPELLARFVATLPKSDTKSPEVVLIPQGEIGAIRVYHTRDSAPYFAGVLMPKRLNADGLKELRRGGLPLFDYHNLLQRIDKLENAKL